MALEQVLADRDSEDEVDDDVADFEDRRVCIMTLIWLLLLFFILFSQLLLQKTSIATAIIRTTIKLEFI